jgi:hypothetical protein
VLHPQQGLHRWRAIDVERRDERDACRRIVCYRGAQRDRELLLVGVRCGQPDDPVPVATGGQHVDEGLGGIWVVADE